MRRKNKDIYPREGYKVCNKCNKEFPIEEFITKSGKKVTCCKECKSIERRKYYESHKDIEKQQSVERTKQWRANNRERSKTYFREYMRKRKGIKETNYRGPNQLEKGQTKYTKAQIIKMSRYNLTPEQFDALPDHCEVCEATTNLHIDHDHSTGKIRGTLCASCNQALGLMKDNYKNIIRLANYLIKE